MLDVIGVAAPSVDARHGEEAEAAAKVAVDEAEAKLALAVDAPPPVLTAAAILSGRTAAADAKIAAEAALAAASNAAREDGVAPNSRQGGADGPPAGVVRVPRDGVRTRRAVVASRRCLRRRSSRVVSPTAKPDGAHSGGSGDQTGNNQTTQPPTANSDPAWHERALRAAHAGGLGDAAVEILRSMASGCAGGATASARASALGACASSPAGRSGNSSRVDGVGVHQVRGARARWPRARSGSTARPATQGVPRGGGVRRQGGRRRARRGRPRRRRRRFG